MSTRTPSRFDGHHWTKAETNHVYRTVNSGVKQGNSKQAMFRRLAEELGQPDVNENNIRAEYYREASKRRAAGERPPVTPPTWKTARKTPRTDPLDSLQEYIASLEERAETAEAELEQLRSKLGTLIAA